MALLAQLGIFPSLDSAKGFQAYLAAVSKPDKIYRDGIAGAAWVDFRAAWLAGSAKGNVMAVKFGGGSGQPG